MRVCAPFFTRAGASASHRAARLAEELKSARNSSGAVERALRRSAERLRKEAEGSTQVSATPRGNQRRVAEAKVEGCLGLCSWRYRTLCLWRYRTLARAACRPRYQIATSSSIFSTSVYACNRSEALQRLYIQGLGPAALPADHECRITVPITSSTLKYAPCAAKSPTYTLTSRSTSEGA